MAVTSYPAAKPRSTTSWPVRPVVATTASEGRAFLEEPGPDQAAGLLAGWNLKRAASSNGRCFVFWNAATFHPLPVRTRL